MIALLLAGAAGLVGGLMTLALLPRWLPDRWLRATPRGTLAQADFFAVFAFGLGRDAAGNETAGLSNAALAEWVVANNPRRKPTLVQEGVYLALRDLESTTHPQLDLRSWVFRLPHDPARYATTGDATLQCWELASLRGLSRPAVVAHDLQQQRMSWLFEAAFAEDRIAIPELPTIPFDARSVQHWGTRSRRNWFLWELFVARPAMGRYGGAFAAGLTVLAGTLVTAGAVFGIALGVLALLTR